jgi:hypothetical protein
MRQELKNAIIRKKTFHFLCLGDEMIDAMKQALEVLERASDAGYSIECEEAITALSQAIEQAEKEATLQEISDIGQEIEQEPFAWVKQDVCEGQFMSSTMLPRKIWWECEKNIGFPIYTAPPKQGIEQEPVAWIQEDRIVPEIGYDCTMTREHPKELGYKPLYTAPQKYCPSENNAAYEKGFVEGMAKQMHSSVDRAVNAMAKQWVGLTEEDKNDCLVEADPCEALATPEAQELMRSVEAKLKEKNGGV